MDPLDPNRINKQRQRLSRGQVNPQEFRSWLSNIAAGKREAWVDRLFMVGELPEDGPDLPSGCVPYLPCSVEAVTSAIELAGVDAEDVFVDIGSGVGRAAALTHLMTGATVTGIEIQSALVEASRALSASLNTPRFTTIKGDAATILGPGLQGSVFFLFCPFGGQRLATVLHSLHAASKTRDIRVCCVDLPLPECSWLEAVADADNVSVYRSV